ncbi:MAG: hypothetical protein ACJA2M_001906 [Polaribacter sp.]|jgi:hypothetical protein
MKNIKQMKNYKIKKLFFALCFLLAFASCESNDDVLTEVVKVKDFSTVELIKLHGGSNKSWKLTEIIIPGKFRDNPGLINKTCAADDIYTFSVPTSEIYESIGEVIIKLGDTRCFETISDAESFEGILSYFPYTLNGVDVFRVALFLDRCRITDTIPAGTTTICFGDIYPLVELTDDRMVFSNATIVGEQTYGFVFEKINE